jgi:hypothetical protein
MINIDYIFEKNDFIYFIYTKYNKKTILYEV